MVRMYMYNHTNNLYWLVCHNHLQKVWSTNHSPFGKVKFNSDWNTCWWNTEYFPEAHLSKQGLVTWQGTLHANFGQPLHCYCVSIKSFLLNCILLDLVLLELLMKHCAWAVRKFFSFYFIFQEELNAPTYLL